MTQTFKTEGTIQATLTKIRSRGNIRFDWVIEDEKNACDSCLICNHYKYNHDNIYKNSGLYVHICLVKAPEFIDVTLPLTLNNGMNTSCVEYFSRRAIR
jgi:hypothetical protein